MELVKIVPPEKVGKLQPGHSTKLVTESGEELAFVSRCVVTFEPESLVTAELTMAVACEEVWALAVMSEASFLEAAKRYGYRVEKTA